MSCTSVMNTIAGQFEDVTVATTVREKLTVTNRHCTCRRKAAIKNDRRRQPRKRLTSEEYKEAKRLSGTRRNRAAYLAAFDLSTGHLVDNGIQVEPWELPTTYIGSDYVIGFVGDPTRTTTFALAFCKARPDSCSIFVNLSSAEEDAEEDPHFEEVYISQKNPPLGFHVETFAVVAD